MPKQILNPPSLFNSLQHGFSQIAIASGSRTVYLSGQVAWDADKQIIGKDDFAAQVRQSFLNLQTAMSEAGGSLSDIVSIRIYIVEDKREETAAISQNLREFFPSESAPTTTWILVRGLASPDFLVELEATAVI
jgi:2-iminobutanoate/2-iminopropanoate deaminase